MFLKQNAEYTCPFKSTVVFITLLSEDFSDPLDWSGPVGISVITLDVD